MPVRPFPVTVLHHEPLPIVLEDLRVLHHHSVATLLGSAGHGASEVQLPPRAVIIRGVPYLVRGPVTRAKRE